MTGLITESENLQNSLGSPASSYRTINIWFVYYHNGWFFFPLSFKGWMGSITSQFHLCLGKAAYLTEKADMQKTGEKMMLAPFTGRESELQTKRKLNFEIARSRSGDHCLEQEKLFLSLESLSTSYISARVPGHSSKVMSIKRNLSLLNNISNYEWISWND